MLRNLQLWQQAGLQPKDTEVHTAALPREEREDPERELAFAPSCVQAMKNIYDIDSEALWRKKKQILSFLLNLYKTTKPAHYYTYFLKSSDVNFYWYTNY